MLDAAGRGQRTAPAAPRRCAAAARKRAERELLRLLVANPEPMAMIEVSADWFASDEHLAALARLAPAIAKGAEPGHPLDMGSLLGDDDSSVAELLRSLAVDDRPLDDPGEVVASLRAWAMERRIADLRRRLERVEPVDGDTPFPAAHRVDSVGAVTEGVAWRSEVIDTGAVVVELTKRGTQRGS